MPKKKKKVTSFYKKFITVLSLCSVLMLWLSAASAYINPGHFRFLSVLGLAFPILLACVLLMFMLCLLTAWKRAWIPLIGMAVCFSSIRTYFPINVPSPAPKSSYKFITYNTMGFASYANGPESEECQALVNFIIDNDPDFFCFQEGNTNPWSFLQDDFFKKAKKVMPYSDSQVIEANVLGCCSKFPILKKELLYKEGMNGVVVFHLLLGEKDTLRIINCHLQSMGLTEDERARYHDMVKHPENGEEMEEHSRLLVSKITKATVLRAAQADSVAAYIEQHRGDNIILCGDFNDTPISYTRQRISDTGLTDAFRTTGNGLGRSFNRDGIIVRIDHLFCSEQWKPYSFHVDKTIHSSDHYPLVGYLDRIKNKK